MTAYRSGEVPDAPVMSSPADAAAYAAYRMPATSAATALALRETQRSLPGWAPVSVLDIGAGTGGASWAAADELDSVRAIMLLEQSSDAVRLGKAILTASGSSVLRAANWRSWRLPAVQPDAVRPDVVQTGASPPRAPIDDSDAARLPAADLAVCAYVLGELSAAQQGMLVALTVRAAPAVLLVEPGTPAGHRRILAGRAQLLAAGYLVASPCPHQLSCPLQIEGDWCHFGVRLQRSALHRQVKEAELSYEDEKLSYVAMVKRGHPAVDPPAGRIVRRPQQRKGLVLLDLCTSDGASKRELVSKSKGELYRRARKASWGDRWDRL